MVKPDERRENVNEEKDGTLTISVKEPREGNRANTRVRELVALHHNITIKEVTIVSGHHSSKKRLSITRES